MHLSFSFAERLREEIFGITEIHCTRWLTYFQKQAAFDKQHWGCLKVRQPHLDRRLRSRQKLGIHQSWRAARKQTFCKT